VNGFAEDGEATTDECLARDDGGTGRHDDAGHHHPMGHHGVERVDGRGIGHAVTDNMRALPHIIQDKHGLDDGPSGRNVLSTAVSEVGIEGLGTRGTEKNGPQHHEPRRVLEQQSYGIIGVESLEDDGLLNGMNDAQTS